MKRKLIDNEELDLNLFLNTISVDVQQYIIKEFASYGLYTDWGRKGIFNKRKEFNDLCWRDAHKWLHILLSDSNTGWSIDVGGKSYVILHLDVVTASSYRFYNLMSELWGEEDIGSTPKQICDDIKDDGRHWKFEIGTCTIDGSITEVDITNPILKFNHNETSLQTHILGHENVSIHVIDADNGDSYDLRIILHVYRDGYYSD